MITLNLEGLLNYFLKGDQLDEAALIAGITVFDLGKMANTHLGFSDATPIAGGFTIFVASAEAASTSASDGKIRGSVIGVIDSHDQILWQKELSGSRKAEGIAIREDTEKIRVYLVTDPDDAATAAELITYAYVKKNAAL